jgi:hypothetical protein
MGPSRSRRRMPRTDAAASGSPASLRRPPPGCGAGCRSVTSPGNARARRFYEAGGWSVEGSERVFDLLGVAVPEMRYRRRLATGE